MFLASRRSAVSKHAACTIALLSFFIAAPIWGAGNPMLDSTGILGLSTTIALAPASLTVRAGASTQVTATQSGIVKTGTWSVTGGAAYGTITASGQYTAPAVLPPLLAYAIIHFVSGTQTADTILTLLNPVPTLSGTSIPSLSKAVTSLTVSGTGFLSKSQVLVNGSLVPTTYVDASHLTATVTLPSAAVTSIALQVSNPAPGAILSSSLSLPVSSSSVSVSPTSLAGGNITLTVTYPAGIPTGAIIALAGLPLKTTSQTSTTITASGYLPPWNSGSVAVTLVSGTSQVAAITVPITPTAISFDVASRFATQTGFGPRLDVITHIQQIGLAAYIAEQESTTPDPYSLQEQPRSHFMRATLGANDLLRKRVGWAFQVLIPEGFSNLPWALQPWETTLEAHAFGTYRQILEDATSNFQVATLLNLPNNFASTDPTLHPNQNFGRELMQLLSLGIVLLNEDGTPALNASGQQQSTYSDNDVVDASRALTGWTTAPPQNPGFTYGGVDASLPLISVESGHDHGSKSVLGTSLAAGQTALQDRSQLLDIIFKHPNLPPFVSKQLIQRLVKSQPSPAYVQRITQVFKNDGTGVRGNLGAVIKAILLDPEARSGDLVPSATDGFVQEPVYQQLAAMSLLGITSFDDQPTYVPEEFKENWWIANSVFSYFSPSYLVPGTSTNSPEFQLIDGVTIVQRSQFMWGVVTGTATGIPAPSTQLFSTFPNLTAMLDALNHILFHGAMPQSTHDAIVTYCGTITDPTLQLQSAVFLALNSDNYNVVQ